ncbi:MAG TPA: ATP-dependent helicase, partial [Anaerolineae bacterium]|nr:ATP-dependent helicase [Anaerolineae bacterium]
MALAKAIRQEFPRLNPAQRKAAGAAEGPLLVVAGPGTGKTLVLVVRALNILLQKLAQPDQVLLCTFTEKAAFELRDRMSSTAAKLGYRGDLSGLLVGTIHGICNDFLLRHRHRTPLGSNYEVLDELTQLLFIFEHFDEIIGPEDEGPYLTRWRTRWTAIEGARRYFNKITEELVDPARLVKSADPFVQAIGRAHKVYARKLIEGNCIDFAHQQKLFLNLLDDSQVGPDISNGVRYVMVDEYQDTNYVQERILLRLAAPQNNICVVGDEDQALYRFRGATVRNILEFPRHFQGCRTVTLSTNYRSHAGIINAYNKFMAAADWSNDPGQPAFRYDKTMVPDPDVRSRRYPAVFCIWGQNEKDEAHRFADLVAFLKERGIAEDESQVALLLRSVRRDHSGPYLEALEHRGIKAFCPRARAYFDNDEVRLMVGCFAVLLRYYGENRGHPTGRPLQEMVDYVDECIAALADKCTGEHPIAQHLQAFTQEIEALKPRQTLDRRLADYFYQFVAWEPFRTYLKDENRARNLASFSSLLNTFQS